MKFIYYATKVTTDKALFIGCYSSLEKFEEILKKHSDGYIKVPVGPPNHEPSYYEYFLTKENLSDISKEELYKCHCIVIYKVEMDKYDPIYEEAMYWW